MFADISGFTRLTEQLAGLGFQAAEHLVDVLNDLYTELLTCAEGYGGDMLKFGGDALFLYFSGPDAPCRAVAAAAAMQRTLASRPAVTAGTRPVRLRMSVGVHAGPFVAFVAGHDEEQLVLLGETVDHVLELEEAANKGEVLVSSTLADVIGEHGGRTTPNAVGHRLRQPPRASRAPTDPAPDAATARRFLSEPLRAHLDSGLVEAEHRQATIAFLRFAVPPERLARPNQAALGADLDALVDATHRAAAKHGTTVLSSDVIRGGAKILLTAGVPTTTTDADERLVATALDLVHAHLAIEFKIGIARGRVFSCEVGSPTRRTYTVMGDAVNLAARVMSHATTGHVLATRSVVAALRSVPTAEPVAPFLVKGKTQPVVADDVTGLTPRSVADIPGTAFAGRDSERSTIVEALEAVRGGAGSALSISGPPGIGKTALLGWLLQQASDLRTVVVAGEPSRATMPFAGYRRAVERLLGLDSTSDPDTVFRAVEHEAPEHLRTWLPLLAPAFGVDRPVTPSIAALDERYRFDRTTAVAAELVDALVAEPTVLAFEDLHWFDAATRSVIDHQRSALTAVRSPLLLCSTTRTPTGPIGDGRDLRLAPLTTDTVTELVRASHPGLPAAVRTSIVAKSAGNPLFAIELANAAAIGDRTETLPDTIEAAIAQRIDDLDPRLRRTLRFVAVAGAQITASTAHSCWGDFDGVADFRDSATWDALADFATYDPSIGTITIRHDLVRATAYDALAYAQRRVLHLRLALHLESQDAPLAVLAHHHGRAGNHAVALRYARRAADDAMAIDATHDALALLELAYDAARHVADDAPQAMSAVERCALTETLGTLYERVGRYDDARVLLTAARKVAGDHVTTARLTRRLGELHERAGRYSLALRQYSLARRDLAGSPNEAPDTEANDARRERIRVDLARAGVKYRQGALRDAAQLAEGAVDAARAIGDEAAVAHGSHLADSALSDLGDERATAYRGVALEIFERLGDLNAAADARTNLGVTAYYEGDWNAAASWYQQAIDEFERSGDVIGAATAANNLGEILSDQGHLDHADEVFRDALAVFERAQYTWGVGHVLSNLGRVARRRSEFDAAVDLLERGISVLRDIGAHQFVFETTARLAEVAIAAVDEREALRILDELTAAPESSTAAPVLLTMIQRLRAMALSLTSHAGAPEAFRSAAAHADAIGSEYEYALTVSIANEMNADVFPESELAAARSILARLGAIGW